jgi:alpha 1,3-glucosidase
MNKKDDLFNMKILRKKHNFKITRTEENFIIYLFAKVPKNLYFIEINHSKKSKFELKINFDPFSIIFSIENKDIIKLNPEEYLHFEDFRKYKEQETESNSSIRLDFEYPNVNNLFGLPERAADIELTDTEGNDLYRLFNIDKFIYSRDKALGLYGSIPFILGLSHDNSIFSGLIWNNPSETYVKIKTSEDEETGKNSKEVIWISETGIMDISLFADSNINNFYFKMHKYIGFANLPPASALGYHQSRWNYKSTADLMGVDKLFDEYDIPYDSIWLDIEVILI